MKKEQKLELQQNSDSTADNSQVRSTCPKPIVMRRFFLWWIRNFKIISIKKAKELRLEFKGNVYGDEINNLNCRSIWIDNNGHRYRVSELSDFR